VTALHSHSEAAEPFVQRHYFLLRRLHSLTGVAPIGLFLFPHLATNSSIVWGRFIGDPSYGDGGVESFQHEVNFIHNLPFLFFIEMFALWLPIAFHAILGVWFARTGRSNVKHYSWSANRRYTLQRLSGYLGVVFIFLHLASLRFGITFGGLFPTFDPVHAASSTALHFGDGLPGLLRAAFYLVCVLALVYHFANGLWTAAITWGLTISAGAQRRFAYVCVAVGLLLGAAGVTAVLGFASLDPVKAREIELKMLGGDGAVHS